MTIMRLDAKFVCFMIDMHVNSLHDSTVVITMSYYMGNAIWCYYLHLNMQIKATRTNGKSRLNNKSVKEYETDGFRSKQCVT